MRHTKNKNKTNKTTTATTKPSVVEAVMAEIKVLGNSKKQFLKEDLMKCIQSRLEEWAGGMIHTLKRSFQTQGMKA